MQTFRAIRFYEKEDTMVRFRFLIAAVALVLIGAGTAFATGQQEIGVEPEELVFWHSYSQQERIDAIEATIAAFEGDNPDYTVRHEVVAWGAFYEKWVSALEAGTLPDMSAALLNQALLMYEAGATQPVDGLVESMGGPDTFLDAPLQNLYYDDHYIGVPHYAHARLLWYRADWLEEAGLSLPQNWDELEAAAEELNNPPNRYGFVIPLGPNSPADIYFFHFLLGAGGRIFDADGNVTINSPEAREAIDYMMGLYESVSPEGSLNYDVRETKSAFITARTAFIIEAPFIIADVMRDADWASPDRLAGMPVPGKDEQPWMAELISLVMMDGTENPEATRSFMEYMYRESEYVSFLHAVPGGQLPTVASVAEGNRFWQHPVIQDYRPSIENAIDGIANGTPVAMSAGVNTWAAVVDGEDLLAGMLQDIATGNKTVDQALGDLEARLQQIVDEN
jgi:multiple sugar transport system substrate-binding protein